MKTAHLPDGTPITANSNAPTEAICPYCGAVLSLRSRLLMNSTERTYFWRHLGNSNPDCIGRKRPLPSRR